MSDQYLKVVKPTDNVATALRDINAGEVVDVAVGDETRSVRVADDVAFGHKLAIEQIAAGETVRKYGVSIGNATEAIEPGSWVHVHNVESNYGRGDKASSDKAAVHE